MIVYENGFLGLLVLSRIHGSSVYKVIIPALLSTLIFFGYHYFPFVLNSYQRKRRPNIDGDDTIHEDIPEVIKIIQHPYTIGAFIAFYTFLLTFRLNFAYGRYWESASAIHQMLSKWLDGAMMLTSFHYQSKQYNYIIPQTFGELSKNGCNGDKQRVVTADEIKGRERNYPGPVSYDQTYEVLQQIELKELREQENALLKTQRPSKSLLHRIYGFCFRNKLKAKKRVSITSQAKSINNKKQSLFVSNRIIDENNIFEIDDEYDDSVAIPIPLRFQQQFLLSETVYDHQDDNKNNPDDMYNNNAIGHKDRQPELQKTKNKERPTSHIRERMPPPSLFLQETAHLFSLLSAVALSTLRNHTIEDIVEKTFLPINEYYPGQTWPPVDSDQLDYNVKVLYGEGSIYYSTLYYVFGMNRSMKRQALYNAARPLSVLGGISDNEIRLLQQARGPYAKVTLISMWIQEFIAREHLNGSTGAVQPPVINRLYQALSDGINGYSQARKVAYVPFPFPNAQIASFFSLAIIFIFPILYDNYVNRLWFAAIMNFTTVLCFLGLHEVARELENPFHNVPNELPIITFQAQYNEALVTMYAGYHPDSWWTVSPSKLNTPPPPPPMDHASVSSSSSNTSASSFVFHKRQIP